MASRLIALRPPLSPDPCRPWQVMEDQESAEPVSWVLPEPPAKSASSFGLYAAVQAGPGTRSHAAVLLPGELGGRSELCREKAQPVKVSEMNHRHPVQLGSDVSRLLFCA
ncbi:hypothetical protein LEMLEM_LOCUS16416 [Lemmus lemmus]